MTTRVLVVDDEQSLARWWRGAGTRRPPGGGVFDGPFKVTVTREWTRDVVVLTWGARADGIEVCRQLRTFTDCYVIMLTARADEVTSSWDWGSGRTTT